VPPPPVYAPPPRASFPLWGKALLGCGCLLVAFVALIGFGLSRFIAGNRGRFQTDFCMANVRFAQRGINLYSQDYDEALPNAAAWMDNVTPYLRNRTELRCPIVRVANPKGYGYAFNKKLSGIKSSKIDTPGVVPVVYDSSDTERNASDAFTSLPSPPRHVSREQTPSGSTTSHVNIVAYADGHVRFRSADGATKDAPSTNFRRNLFGPKQKTK